MENFIELNRTFFEIPVSGDNSVYAENDITQTYQLKGKSSFNWDELLKEFRIILLAEAGAGKTQEILYATNTLRRENKNSFFLRLEHVVDNFDIAFEVGSYEEFQKMG